jgi:hypothetical protein
MRELGYHVEKTEQWIPGANIRKDLFGFGDLLCIHTDRYMPMVIVQATSSSNVAARVKKIHDSPLLPIVLNHFKVVVHGTYPDGTLREVEIL